RLVDLSYEWESISTKESTRPPNHLERNGHAGPGRLRPPDLPSPRLPRGRPFRHLDRDAGPARSPALVGAEAANAQGPPAPSRPCLDGRHPPEGPPGRPEGRGGRRRIGRAEA